MTANRWWVQAAARWLARFDAVKGQIQSFSLSVTAFSTFSLLLQQAGYGAIVPYVATFGVIGGIGYTYLYTEGGVYNQKQRDMSDIGDNYSGPTMLMDAKITARQLALLVYLLQNGDVTDYEEVVERMDQITYEEWMNLRDGLDADELEGKI